MDSVASGATDHPSLGDRRSMPSTPGALVSYAPIDDEDYGGARPELRKLLTRAVRAASGRHDIEIVQDRTDLGWGEPCPTSLAEGLEASRGLIPIKSPSFFRSDDCKPAWQTFLAIEEIAERTT